MPTSVARRQLSWLGTTSPQLHWHQLRSDPSSVAQKAVGSTSVASRPPLLSQVSSAGTATTPGAAERGATPECNAPSVAGTGASGGTVRVGPNRIGSSPPGTDTILTGLQSKSTTPKQSTPPPASRAKSWVPTWRATPLAAAPLQDTVCPRLRPGPWKVYVVKADGASCTCGS